MQEAACSVHIRSSWVSFIMYHISVYICQLVGLQAVRSIHSTSFNFNVNLISKIVFVHILPIALNV